MKVLFRVDTSKSIGIGHLMRCLSLAEALKRKGCDSFFLIRDFDKIAFHLIKKNNFRRIEIMASKVDLSRDFNALKSSIFKYGIDFVVTDSYILNTTYYNNIKKLGTRLLVIDDLAKNSIPADIILNQNVYADRLSYSTDRSTKLLLGPKYALLKKNFSIKRNCYAPSKSLKNILITLGEGLDEKEDPLIKVINSLKGLNKYKLNVRIITKISPGSRSIIRSILKDSDMKYELKDFASNVWKDMLWAELAICGGGTTTYELCCLGIPFITVVVADNQELNAEFLEKKNISINLGWHNKLNIAEIRTKLLGLIDDYRKRAIMSRNGRELVDGRGAERVAEVILN